MTRKARFTRPLHGYAATPEPDEEQRPGEWTVRIVEARPGGDFVTVEMLSAPSYSAAVRTAERAQEDADALCLPRRAFVCNRNGIPVSAAGERR